MASSKASPVPIYDSSRRPLPIIEDAAELFRYRDLLWGLVKRDLTIRYKRSVLGFLWTMLNPLFTMIVLTIVFSAVFQFAIEHYAVYLLAGQLLWNFFSQSTTQAIHNLVWGSGIIKKVYAPKSVFVLSAILVGFVNLLLALIPLALIMLITGQPFSLALLFLPVPMILTSFFALGVGFCVSTLAVFFIDVIDIYQVVLMILMYLTPLFYPIAIVPPRYVPFIHLNPMYYFVEVFRAPIYQGTLPDLTLLLWTTVLAVAALGVGWWFFTSKADEFAYRV